MADLNQPADVEVACCCRPWRVPVAQCGWFILFFLELEKLNEARAATGFACHLPKVGLRLF